MCDNGLGAPRDPDNYTTAFKKIAKEAKLDPAVRLHDVRHGLASELARAGVPLVTVSSLLGHSSASFTATQYQHSLRSMGEAATALLNDAIRDDGHMGHGP